MLKPCLHVRLRGFDEDDLVASDCSLFMLDSCCCSIAYTNCLKDTSFNNSSENVANMNSEQFEASSNPDTD